MSLVNQAGLLLPERVTASAGLNNPVADSAAESLESNKPGELLRIRSFNFDLQTSGVAGNRFVGYEIADPLGHTFVEALTPALATINNLYGICGFVGAPLQASSRTANLPLADIALPAGWKIVYIAPFKQAGDTFPLFRTLYEYI